MYFCLVDLPYGLVLLETYFIFNPADNSSKLDFSLFALYKHGDELYDYLTYIKHKIYI